MTNGDATRAPADPIRPAELVPVAALVALAGIFVALVWPYEADDAFITLRYARLLAEGAGLRFNPGAAPVEGFTSPLSVFAGALVLRAGVEPLGVFKALGAAAALACVAQVYCLGRRWRLAHGPALVAAALLALSGGLALWAVSGMETAVYTLLLLVGLDLFTRDAPRTDLLGALALLVACWTRPEAPVLVAALGAHRLWIRVREGRSLPEIVRRDAPWALAIALPYAAYFAARIAYFGYLFPNPVYWKASNADASVLTTVAAAFVKGWWPLLVFALFGIRRAPAAAVLVAAAIALFSTAQRHVVGNVGTMSFLDRYFVPVEPALALAAAAGIEALGRRFRGTGAKGVTAAAYSALALWLVANPWHSILEATVYAETRRAAVEPRNRALTEALNARLGPGDWLAVGDVGEIGYRFHGKVHDTFGLNSTDFTHRFGRDMERYVAWIFSEAPQAVVVAVSDDDAGRRSTVFEPEAALLAQPGFGDRYRLVGVHGREETPQYYYALFERTTTRRSGPSAPLAETASPR